jgi:hypothetical protein
VQYKFTHKQYTEPNIHNNKKNLEVRAVYRLCELFPGICLTTEEKTRENLSYDSRNAPRCPCGSSTVYIYTQTIHKKHNEDKQYTEKQNAFEKFQSFFFHNTENQTVSISPIQQLQIYSFLIFFIHNTGFQNRKIYTHHYILHAIFVSLELYSLREKGLRPMRSYVCTRPG